MKIFALALSLELLLWAIAPSPGRAESLIMGYSGAGITTDLQRVIDKQKIWDKYGLNVKAVYFNSGSVMTQAMAGGNIQISDSDVPAMLGLAASGVADLRVISVTIDRIEHLFVTRKNIRKPEDLRGKRIAVSRIGSASDIVTRMVIRQWKIDPEKDVFILQSGNTPTRMTALIAGRIDGALISPDNLHNVLVSGCCRILADLSQLPLDYARFGATVPVALLKTQRDMLRRYLQAILEGIYAFKTRPDVVYSVFADEGMRDSTAMKDLYARLSGALREYPVPEPVGIQNALDSVANPNARKVKPEDVIDTTLIEEIKRSGFIDRLYGRAPKS